jgi:hypothetical protein
MWFSTRRSFCRTHSPARSENAVSHSLTGTESVQSRWDSSSETRHPIFGASLFRLTIGFSQSSDCQSSPQSRKFDFEPVAFRSGMTADDLEICGGGVVEIPFSGLKGLMEQSA